MKASDKHKTFIEYSVSERKKIFKLWQVVSKCGTNPEKLAEAYGIDQEVLNEIITDGILQIERRNRFCAEEIKKILVEKYLPAFREQLSTHKSPFILLFEKQKKIEKGELIILKSVEEHNIFFSNGTRISWTNNCHNNPGDYADFASLGDSVIGKEFDANLKFIAADNSGFFFGNTLENAIYVPCYAKYFRHDKINVFYDGEKVLEVVPCDKTPHDDDDDY